MKVIMLAVAISAPLPLSAQTSAAPPTARMFEIGAAVDSFAAVSPSGNVGMVYGQVRTKVPLTARFSLDVFAEIPRHELRTTHGLYGIHVKQRLVRASHGRTEVFLTYGAIGSYQHAPSYEWGYTDERGVAHMHREPSRTAVGWPVLPMVGGGVQQQVAGRLIVRFDAQGITAFPVFPIAIGRLTAGLSVPLGRLTTR